MKYICREQSVDRETVFEFIKFLLEPDYNLIIYIDGCYWHACPDHFPNGKKPNYDNARVPYLTKCGYNVEIIWEHDIKKRLNEVIQTICLKYNIPVLTIS